MMFYSTRFTKRKRKKMNNLTFTRCHAHANRISNKILQTIGIGNDVMMWENGDLTITIDNHGLVNAIVDILIPFWALEWQSDEKCRDKMLFLEFKYPKTVESVAKE